VLVVGVAEPEQFEQNLATALEPDLTDEDRRVLDALQGTDDFDDFRLAQRDFFVEGFV
jgi:hypothetical protein